MSRLVQATCRYFLRVFGPGPGAQRGLVAADDPGQDDQRPDRRVRRGDRPGGAGQQARAPTRRTGRVPDIDSMMSAQRSTGTWCITIKNTHQAWKFSP